MEQTPTKKTTANRKPLFALGQVLATRGAVDKLAMNEESFMVASLMSRLHAVGDWAHDCEEDIQTNHRSIKNGARIMSVQYDPLGTKYWIITDAGHNEKGASVTTILLPEEY
jgi:hypothetical protein